jgi:hypothetical protein
MTKQRRNKSSVPSVNIDDLTSGLITKSEIVETPVKAVEAPVEEAPEATEAPIEATEAPIEATEAPEAPIEAPEAPIEAPEVTEAPIEAPEARVEEASDTLPPIKMTLRTWQRLVKPEEELIVNASSQDGYDRWLPWPIGMTYSFSDYNGPLEATMIGSHDKTVLCAFSIVTDRSRRQVRNRDTFARTLTANGVINEYSSDSGIRYYFSLPTYKFVICPEGNGIDTHRLYEALMAGCIPIVERRPHIADKYKGCPILYTTDYSEINELYLREKYREMIDKEYDFSALYLSTYSDEEQAAIKANSDYWCRTFKVRKWY